MRRNLLTRSARWGKLAYRKNGDFPGTAVILIHGAVGDSRLYRYQLRHFGERYKTIALDLPGHGHSASDERPGIDDYVDAIEDVVAEEGISSFVLIGHSMGGGVSLEACKRGIRGLAGMVLVSTSPVLPISQGMVDMIDRDDMNSLAELIVRTVFSKKTELLIGFAKNGLYDMNRRIIKTDVDICRDMDYTGVLAEIDIPVLVVANRGDMVVSYDLTASLANRIRNSRLVIFDQAGHVPFFENAIVFNEAVDRFLEDIIVQYPGSVP
jgi:pimeloyl-ACP methyl ester carboxylesterase